MNHQKQTRRPHPASPTRLMHIRSPLDLDQETMRTLGYRVTDVVAEHLASLRDQPVLTQLGRAEADKLLAGPAPEEPVAFDEIMTIFRERIAAHHAREPHPGFMAYVPSCPTFPAVLGDWLATGFNFYAGIWKVAGGPNEVEVVVLEWFRQWMGMPEGSAGLLTSGGSQANLTAIVAARHAAVGDDATRLARLVMYSSDQTHSSVTRAGWIAGVPRDQVRSVPTDAHRRMDAQALAKQIGLDREGGLIPFLVVANAGTTNTGAVDPMGEIADLCERENVWMHVDGAYGAFAALTPAGRTQLAGMERADTITLDPHKLLFVPFECGCLLAREPARLAAAYRLYPEYLKELEVQGTEVNFADFGEQLTRYSRAMKVWLSVNYFGMKTICEGIQGAMDVARHAESVVRSTEGLEVLSPAQMGIFCFRVKPEGLEDGAELDALNARVLDAINAEGPWFISSTRLDGKLSLRICVTGYRTTRADVEGLMATAVAVATLQPSQ
jgi:aromatic-L-amino-acid/L-tryptophan decarboxylase